jgi:hypothetical protein
MQSITKRLLFYDGKGCLMQFLDLMQNRYLQIVSFAFAMYVCVMGCRFLALSNSFVVAHFGMYRLHAILPASLNNIALVSVPTQYFTLTREGCPLLSLNISDLHIAAFEAPAATDGFTVIITSPWRGPETRFLLQGSADGGRTWSFAAASAYRWAPSGVRFLDATADTTSTDQLVVDYRPTWPALVHHAAFPLLTSAGWAATMLCGLLTTIPIARAVAYAALAAGFIALGPGSEAMAPLVRLLNCALIGTALLSAEGFLAHVCALAGALGLLQTAVADCALVADCGAIHADPPVASAALAIVSGTFVALRRRYLARLRREAAADAAAWDREWSAAAAAEAAAAPPGGPSAVQELMALTAAAEAVLSASVAAWPARHCTPGRAPAAASESRRPQPGAPGRRRSLSRLSSALTRRLSASFSAGAAVELPPVDSLDQLYAQAVVAAPLLRAACAGWAVAGAGDLHPADAAANAGSGPAAADAGRLCCDGLAGWVRRGWVAPRDYILDEMFS